MDTKKTKLPKLRKNLDKSPYECHYCGTRFRREGNFLKHSCKDMQREELLNTIDGERAWIYYSDWMKLKCRPVYTKKAFIRSRFFNAFINFSKYATRAKIPKIDLYIKYMIKNDYPPYMWVMDKVYGRYIDYYDYKIDPIISVKVSIETLDNLADTFRCNIDDVFNRTSHNTIISLIRQRQISPWLLIHSPQFLKYVNKASTEHEMILKSFISPMTWKKKLEKIPEKKRKLIRDIVRALNL